MQRVLQAIMILAAALPPSVSAGPGRAQGGAPLACRDLEARFLRQAEITAGLRCEMRRDPDAQRRMAAALMRCTRADRVDIAEHANRIGAAIETCVANRLRAARAGTADQGSSPDAGSASGERQVRAPAGGDRAKTAAERILELLAEAPRVDGLPGGVTVQPGARDLNFRSGLVWSYAGPIAGMHCVHWAEPSDPHSWDDNFLCTDRDVGLQWSYRGPILGRGLNCILVREKSDPHDWHDNYFCWPRDLKVAFRFSSTGRIEGMRCVAIVEPSDPHTWRDNYLCYQGEG